MHLTNSQDFFSLAQMVDWSILRLPRGLVKAYSSVAQDDRCRHFIKTSFRVCTKSPVLIWHKYIPLGKAEAFHRTT
jgi:hypothetical protein